MKTVENEKYIGDWLSVVQRSVGALDFGVVQIIVHDSKVVQIERTEKVRFDGRQNKVKSEMEVEK
ncbi:MAG: YezD family protein [Phycisphaerae bacterium]|nr:YezD family protein [Phycisphaerae bacterium]